MNEFLLLVAIMIAVCVFLNNASFRVGIPVLVVFIAFGMLSGMAIPKLSTNENEVGQVCTVALIFIMFYGGFGTRWQTARPVALQAGLLATLGVLLTAGITGLCCHYLLDWGWMESFLMGSVIASTDAASVFSILRSRKLCLKKGLTPLLEMESGSNDPCSNILTLLMISLISGKATVGGTVWLILAQFGLGALFGLVISTLAVYAMRRINFATSGFDSLFVLAIALLSYAVPSLFDGNGYLSAYIVGIVLGNATFKGKKELVNFFDGTTGLMQVVIFFMLGLLVEPSRLHACLLPALAIFFILLLVARPVALTSILAPFKKYGARDLCLMSVCGLRGAASIVFAIVAAVTINDDLLKNDLIDIVFCVVLLSLLLQGTLIPYAARKLDLVDNDGDVMKTFSDFSEEVGLQFVEHRINALHLWCGKRIRDIEIPAEYLLCLVIRSDGTRLIPVGDTEFQDGDRVISAAKEFDGSSSSIRIERHPLASNSRWEGKCVKDYPSRGSQIMLIQRGDDSIIPHGDTLLASGDVLYINRTLVKE